MPETKSPAELAELLDTAQQSAVAITDGDPFTSITVDAAYRAQHALVARRGARGDAPVGVKLGFTSRAKMQQMGVDSLIVGTVTESMHVGDGESLSLEGFIHPRIEPEVAFRLSRDLAPDATDDDLLNAVDAVAPALEIIDSRYAGFSFNLSSVLADNTSAAAFAIGPWRRFEVHAPLSNLAVRLIVGDALAAVGSTAAIMGNPLRVLPALLATVKEHGFTLRAGDVILAGAATAAEPLVAGLAQAHVAGLGTVSITVTGGPDE